MAKKLKLSGCPFCGGIAHWTKANFQIRMVDRVQCLECLAEIEGDYKPQSALDLWNTRTADHYVHKSDREVNIDGENL